MRRTLGIIAIALLTLAAGCGGSKARNDSTRSGTTTLPAKQASTDRTSINVYTPVTSAGSVAAGIRIEGTTAGNDCWSSGASARSDVFRCIGRNRIYDPCFAAQTYSAPFYVLCPLFTPDAKVLRINLATQLAPGNTSGDPTRFAPWAVQTTSGTWCTLFTGASSLLAGMRINYGCDDGGVLLGDPRRNTKIWTIFYASSYKASQYQPVALRSAWW